MALQFPQGSPLHGSYTTNTFQRRSSPAPGGFVPYRRAPQPQGQSVYSPAPPQAPSAQMTPKQQWRMGNAQPIQPSPQGTPYGGSPAPASTYRPSGGEGGGGGEGGRRGGEGGPRGGEGGGGGEGGYRPQPYGAPQRPYGNPFGGQPMYGNPFGGNPFGGWKMPSPQFPGGMGYGQPFGGQPMYGNPFGNFPIP